MRTRYCNETFSRVLRQTICYPVLSISKSLLKNFLTRVNRILDAVGNNELRFKVDAIDEKVVLEGLQKVANRITLGLVVASLIVGAAMLMRVETSFRIFGYPGLAMIFFLLAAAAGLVLAFSILFYDEKRRKKTLSMTRFDGSSSCRDQFFQAANFFFTQRSKRQSESDPRLVRRNLTAQRQPLARRKLDLQIHCSHRAQLFRKYLRSNLRD